MTAAALLLAGLPLYRLLARGAEPALRVAALPTHPEQEGYLALLGLAELEPPGEVERALPGGAHAPDVQGFLAAVRAREEERAREALDRSARESPRPAVEAGCFVLAVESDRPRAYLVLAVATDGAATRLYPDPASPAAVLPAGRHVLPRPVIDPGAALPYHPGFVVPLRAGELRAIVAARDEPPGAGELEALDRVLERRAAGIEEWLAERDFEVRTAVLREPE